MLAWSKTGRDEFGCQFDGGYMTLTRVSGWTWEGGVFRPTSTRSMGRGSLRQLRDAAEAIASGQPSPWRKGKRRGYRFSATGDRCIYFWSFECAAWLAAAPGANDERFASAAAARAYCDKAIGGAS